MKPDLLLACVVLSAAYAGAAGGAVQGEGRAALDRFLEWKAEPANAELGFHDALSKYGRKLGADGAPAAQVERILALIVAHDEGRWYDRIYEAPPTFDTEPNRWLVEAVEQVPPGVALDVGMGQGRNAVYLARKGWTVTGFDVARVGLERARENAAAAGVTITTVHASDEEFDFGTERWDLIAIVYALEKRSVHRARDALKPGGLIVVEAGHVDTPQDAPFEYRSNELLEIFEGFRILKYEETTGPYDWGPEQIPLVRLVAQKPR